MTNPPQRSLLDGRNVAQLDEREIFRAIQVFITLDDSVNARHEPNSWTRFQINLDPITNQQFGEVVFSADLFPGQNVANPNAMLSLRGAAAHELAHYYRWESKTELPHGEMVHLDEAMTSLEAALRYSAGLGPVDISGLISDALHRLRLFVSETNAAKAMAADAAEAHEAPAACSVQGAPASSIGPAQALD